MTARALLLATVVTLAAAAPAGAACSTARIPVALAERDAPRVTIAGTLCRPSGRTPRVVQLLVHGSTYDRRYWDWPGHGGTYSYARAMQRAGYATLAIDRLGSGTSTHPDAGLVTYANNVRAVDQVVDWLARRLPRARVVLVGHSYGTLVGAAVASRRRDIAAFVATGATTGAGTTTAGGIAPCLIDARTDPVTRALVPKGGGGAGYLTSRAGCRAGVFFDAAFADPAVIAEDEARKGTLTPAEVVGSPLSGAGAWPVGGVRAPVLLAVGDRDALFCAPAAVCSSAAALEASERARWRRARVTGVVQPESGHNLNLHRSAPAFFSAVACWLGARVPADGTRRRCSAPG